MILPCTRCPLRTKPIFTPFTDSELKFMLRFKVGEIRVEKGATILLEGSSSPQLYTVLQGMGTRSKLLENGNRQVVSFLFPGDFIGMQAAVMGEMKHSAVATTPMRLCVFSRADLWRMYRTHPERSYDVTWISAVEEHFLGETLATLGRRDATQRIAWAFIRLFRRIRAVGLGDDTTVPLPFRQQDLADALGLSIVHVNKTIARLRERQLAVWADGRLTVSNAKALADMAMVDDGPPERRPLI